MVNEEIGFGKWEDKVIKNIFVFMGVYKILKNIKIIGIIGEDKEVNMIDIVILVGVVVGFIFLINLILIVIYKIIIFLKVGNIIVFFLYLNVKNCIFEIVNIISEVVIKVGVLEDLILCIINLSIVGINELMKYKDINLILVIGGEVMVRVVYFLGILVIGVGLGNGLVFIDKLVNVKLVIKRIIDFKIFDNGVICVLE